MMMKTSVVSVLAVCGALSLCAAADDQRPPSAAPPAAAASTPQAPKKQNLGAWWQKNALEYTPMPDQWLFHAEGTLSYMNASGNTTGSTFDTSANAEIRKSRITSISYVQLSRKNMVYGFGQGTVDYAERTLREQVDIGVTPRTMFVVGIEAYRNTLMFMDKRLNVYGGMGATLYRNEKQQVTFTGGVGHADFTFDRVRMMTINPSRTGLLNAEPSSGGALGMQTWRWKVSPRFSFSEDASYMKYFDSYLGHRWAINLNGNVPINKLFSFQLTYRLREETNTIIEALGLSPRDRTFLMGIKASI
jgi:hypothetical protein